MTDQKLQLQTCPREHSLHGIDADLIAQREARRKGLVCARLFLIFAGSTHAPFNFLYREHACPLDFSLHAGAVKRFRSSGLFSQEKDHQEDQPASRQLVHLGRMARLACLPWRIGKSRKSRQCRELGGMARRACRRGEPKITKIAPN